MATNPSMPIDHEPAASDKWGQYFAWGTFFGGGIAAVLSKMRWRSWRKRKQDLRQMLQEIADEDALKSVLRHERTHWQRGRKDESGG